jgi:hypothetical protein
VEFSWQRIKCTLMYPHLLCTYLQPALHADEIRAPTCVTHTLTPEKASQPGGREGGGGGGGSTVRERIDGVDFLIRRLACGASREIAARSGAAFSKWHGKAGSLSERRLPPRVIGSLISPV